MKRKLESDLLIKCISDKHLYIAKDLKTPGKMMEALTHLFERKSIFWI